MKPKMLTHAGCIVFREDGEKKLYLIVSSSTGRHWVLPKGHIEKGESAEQAALRELREEAGVEGEILQPIPLQTYDKGDQPILIQYYIARFIGTTQTREGRRLRWEGAEKALETLSFEESKQALQHALDLIRRMS